MRSGATHRAYRRPALAAASWAELLQRVFGVDALRCRCGERMRILAAITDSAVVQRILVCMGLPPGAPPLGSARPPEPLTEPWLDESDANFDQTPPSDWAIDT